MINYDRDEQPCSQAAEAMFELKLAGLTDGASGLPLQTKYMHENAYITAYVIGITKWKEELDRREAENFAQSGLEF